jgi:hypothetical protein
MFVFLQKNNSGPVAVGGLNEIPYNVKGCQHSRAVYECGPDRLAVRLLRNYRKKAERLQGVLPSLDVDLLNMHANDRHAILIVNPN